MKKTVEIKLAARKAIPARTKKVVKTLCDICGKKSADDYGNERKCACCGRDICREHQNYDPDEPGDYGSYFCPICIELFIPARTSLKEKHWQEEEKLEAKFKKLSLATPTKVIEGGSE